ncbi:MAG: FixH family protein [Gammaproteobacteria bacterium]|nr:FixH family protein [Gammaproteobacteria bacterium]MCW8839978.1 FixH family protein [Gammaproteobacteria bacterium]MCW8927802.1 FixH family protein [Gammaproteobacteria bacterium]MCW8958269.1 FixH family protein [Gammaproteobacteria bacterium]MCW8972924.1 FixH family protein [Gammaproteobacteria bacterium]
MFISQNNRAAMRNPWVLGWLGLLVTVVVVNIAFILTAFKTNPGLVEEGYYEKGREVEKNFQTKLEARNRLGWDIRLQNPETVVAGREANYSVNITDKVGMPLRDATVTLHAYRPSDASADLTSKMELVTNGVYQSRFVLPLKGIWDLKVAVQRNNDELEIARRINVVVP